MSQVENITQEQYDKLKVFLIGTFNVRFLDDEKPDVIESFEIAIDTGKIIGYFLKNNSLELHYSGNVQPSYNKLIEQIKRLNGNIKEQSSHQANDLDSLLRHISTCRICKTKLSEILKHIEN